MNSGDKIKKKKSLFIVKIDFFKFLLISKDFNITGVPFYVIDDKFGISGAQPPEVIVDAINQSNNNH